MSLKTFWRKWHQRLTWEHLDAPTPNAVHWMITCWFYEEKGSYRSDDHYASTAKGYPACQWATNDNDNKFIWHPKDWVGSDDEHNQLVDTLTCKRCRQMFLDL